MNSLFLISFCFSLAAEKPSSPVKLVDSLSVEEKIGIIHAQSKFSSRGVPRLGIPENTMTDGPFGIREEVQWDNWDSAGWTNDSCTAYPSMNALAATWNTELALLYGKSIGEEARYRNKNVLLGPAINIIRVPLNGRNWEYFSEDPLLTSAMVIPYIKGVQSNGVAACVKHFALNNQEMYRSRTNVTVSDRALREIYLPGFEAAVKEGGAWAVMGAYNKYRGQHCCHNEYLVNDILKGEWGFDGVFISDWGGVHDTHQAVYNGLDMEFGTKTNGLDQNVRNAYDSYYLAKPYLDGIRSGEFGAEELDDKVARVLRLAERTTLDRYRPFGSLATEKHDADALAIALESIVLLKNDGILPLDRECGKKVLVIGENAMCGLTQTGGASSALHVRNDVPIRKGIVDLVGDDIDISFCNGYKCWDADSGIRAALKREALDKAVDCDIILYVGGLNKSQGCDSEGNDRMSMKMPWGQDELLCDLCAMGKKVVVVLTGGNAVEMPWIDKVNAVMMVWYGGGQSGNAVAQTLFGMNNPSGKLPFSIPKKLEDCGAIALGEYPGDGENVTYNEGIYVGYRYHDKYGVVPLFPFGYGLSYTKFDYGKLVAGRKKLRLGSCIKVSIPVTNSGPVDGKETVEFYVSKPSSSIDMPVRELCGFRKVYVPSGQTRVVTFSVRPEMLRYYDEDSGCWQYAYGDFELSAGASSKDIKSVISINFKK